MIGYINYFSNNNKKMSFIADENKLLKNHTKIWKKLRT